MALDGEREWEIARPGHHLAVALNPAGPLVVDLAATLQAGAAHGAFAERSLAPL